MELDQAKIKEDLGPEFVDEEPEEVELESESNYCMFCGSEFDTERGLKIHEGKVHQS